MSPQCSDYASLSEPLSPPHPDDNASPAAWSKIAHEQLKLLDDLQERWTELRLRETALLHEQERWADWRAREEDELERSRAELQTWIAQESRRLGQQKAAFQAERERWAREVRAQEQALVKALEDLRQEGLLHEEGKRRKELAADYEVSSSDERISLRRELSALRKTLLLREAEVKRLRHQRRQKPPRSTHLSRRKDVVRHSDRKKCPSSPSPSESGNSSSSSAAQDTVTTSPPRCHSRRDKKVSSPRLPPKPTEHLIKCDSAPPPVLETESPTLRVRHVEEGNMLSIYWQGRSTPKSETLRPSSQTRLPPRSRIISVDDTGPLARRSSLRAPPQSPIEMRAPKPSPDLSRVEPAYPFSRNATVDLGEFYRQIPPPQLSSNTTEEEEPKQKLRRASEILAHMRSPTLHGASRGPSPPSQDAVLGLSSSSSTDEAEEARYKRLEEELNRRVHRV